MYYVSIMLQNKKYFSKQFPEEILFPELSYFESTLFRQYFVSLYVVWYTFRAYRPTMWAYVQS